MRGSHMDGNNGSCSIHSVRGATVSCKVFASVDQMRTQTTPRADNATTGPVDVWFAFVK